MATVFVISPDWMLRAGLRAELREQGIETLGFATVGDAAQAVDAEHPPSVIAVEAAEYPTAARWRAGLQGHAPILVVASALESVPDLENADRLLMRPVRIGDVAAQIKNLLKGIPA
jgi:DNA-binding response OmpR family regulator